MAGASSRTPQVGPRVGGWGDNQADSSRAQVLSGQQGGNTEGKEQRERKRKRRGKGNTHRNVGSFSSTLWMCCHSLIRVSNFCMHAWAHARAAGSLLLQLPREATEAESMHSTHSMQSTQSVLRLLRGATETEGRQAAVHTPHLLDPLPGQELLLILAHLAAAGEAPSAAQPQLSLLHGLLRCDVAQLQLFPCTAAVSE